MKGMIDAFGYEWRMVCSGFDPPMPFPHNSPWLRKAPGEAEAELAHLNSIGVIDAILSDDVDNFLFGAKMVVRKCVVCLHAGSIYVTHNQMIPNLAQALISLATVSILRKTPMAVRTVTIPPSTLPRTSSHTHQSSSLVVDSF
jgi:Holliday junction resolvase YEN1